MRCQSSLSSEALMSCVGLTFSFQHVLRLSRYFDLWHPLALLPSTIPVATKFLGHAVSWRACPRKLSCRWRIVVFISVRVRTQHFQISSLFFSLFAFVCLFICLLLLSLFTLLIIIAHNHHRWPAMMVFTFLAACHYLNLCMYIILPILLFHWYGK